MPPGHFCMRMGLVHRQMAMHGAAASVFNAKLQLQVETAVRDMHIWHGVAIDIVTGGAVIQLQR